MIARIVGYILLLVGGAGYISVQDPDVRFPALGLAGVGLVAIIEGAISQITQGTAQS